MPRTSRTLSKPSGARRRRRGRGRVTPGGKVRSATTALPSVIARPSAPAGTKARIAGEVRIPWSESGVDVEAGFALSEEEQIESAKYLPRHLPKRLFEEERFLFPETYGVNRVRLLVKDPQWLFAYWDVDPHSVNELRNEIGERALALTRLTLRITDRSRRDSSVILLPYGVRTWYVQAEGAPRTYRAELGWTLPSGEFRMLAESNSASTPQSGPSASPAPRRFHFTASAEALHKAAQSAAASPEVSGSAPEPSGPAASSESRPGGKKRRKGGASDVFRR